MLRKAPYIPKLPDFLSLCERNYAALYHLLPSSTTVGASALIQLTAHDIYRVTILEAAPFTTRVKIELSSGQQHFFQPSFDVQLYHDARLAEVVRAQQQWRFIGVYPYPNNTMSQPDEKRQINLLLRDWLNLCSRQGYCAEPVVL
ncbi:DUF1249 domain-containing protein [Alishewanella tabrizica]|uniref:Dehydrogenase n=1 Tax=Alishewanella tabrizica TaxID=671278 RepID=A0ABQ2WHA8_9ALTE|nr:DUF1249 domain-containing protein [Alishewanella tabrizica]GGW56300.1 hypothetical protein GCM10008111_10590 [Alishewanella tabrizica]